MLLGTAPQANAGGKIISTGQILYSSGLSVTTDCGITNVGKKPVTILSVALIHQKTTGPASFDTCTTSPIVPGDTCRFGGAGDVFGGGIAEVKGSTAAIRGRCKVYDSTDSIATTLQSADLR